MQSPFKEVKAITIHLDKPQPDPSGSPAMAEAVFVEPEFFHVDEKSDVTTFTFNLAGGDGSKITGFRFMDTSPAFSGNNQWFVPSGTPPGKWQEGPQFRNMKIAPGGRSMSVDCMRGDPTLFLYVLEWEDADGVRHVCDPKIRNEGYGGAIGAAK